MSCLAMDLKTFKKEYEAEISEQWCNNYYHMLAIPAWFIEQEYIKHVKKYDIRAWMRYTMNQYREEKTGLVFN